MGKHSTAGLKVAVPFSDLAFAEKMLEAQRILKEKGGAVFNPRTYIQRSMSVSHFSTWPNFSQMIARCAHMQWIKKRIAEQEEERKRKEAEAPLDCAPEPSPEESIRLTQELADKFYDAQTGEPSVVSTDPMTHTITTMAGGI